jgi:N utilization substance protein A
LGDTVEIEVTPADFGRIAAQTAKQVIMQKIREAARDAIYQEFSEQEGQVVPGTIQRIEGRRVYVDLGRVEGILPEREQIRNERYRPGLRMRFYVLETRRTTRQPQIILSRTHPGLLRRLFEIEVPEIYEGIVEVKSVAREAGSRSKVAVASRDPHVDPVGACVGHRGSRVQAIVDELGGEKIDIIRWHEDPRQYIAEALGPARVKEVIIKDPERRIAAVIVSSDQQSLAIGRSGQNVRLAARLTGWRLDIRNEEEWQAEQAAAASEEVAS